MLGFKCKSREGCSNLELLCQLNSTSDDYEPQTSGDTTTKDLGSSGEHGPLTDSLPPTPGGRNTARHLSATAAAAAARASSARAAASNRLASRGQETEAAGLLPNARQTSGREHEELGGDHRSGRPGDQSPPGELATASSLDSPVAQLPSAQQARQNRRLSLHRSHQRASGSGSGGGLALIGPGAAGKFGAAPALGASGAGKRSSGAGPVSSTALSPAGAPLSSSANNSGGGRAPGAKQSGGQQPGGASHRAYLASDNERHKRKLAKARERRATLILGLIMAAFICSWLPFFTFYVLRALCHVCRDYISPRFEAFIFWMGYCNSAINPIIYTIFNRDFRKAFRKILFKCL